MIKRALNILALLLLNSSQYSALDLPGVTPHTYKEGDSVPLHVNSLTPIYIRTDSSENILPYEYYDKDFGFCEPKDGPKLQSENLGGILFGDRIYNSPFKVSINISLL
jgi:transmembrane 9 superfamily protein 2/4